MTFSQRDNRWSNIELGTGHGYTLGNYGCVLTSVASLLVNCFGKDTDPDIFDSPFLSRLII